MSVLEHAQTGKPAGYRSNNHSKWEYSNSLYQRHLELYLERMFMYLNMTGAKRVLDAGCGEGIVYRAMRERGWQGEWTGFDFSAEAVEFARIASPDANWLHASAYEIPFPDQAFDLVFSSQVLEHLPNPEVPLSEYNRVSSKWLLLSVPLEPWFRSFTWLSIHLHLGADPGHVNHWTPSAFRSFAKTAGRLHTWDWTTVYQIALIETEMP
ncbi:MAG: class I SAM-dependent methyltransferase [Calditrichota bacterium]